MMALHKSKLVLIILLINSFTKIAFTSTVPVAAPESGISSAVEPTIVEPLPSAVQPINPSEPLPSAPIQPVPSVPIQPVPSVPIQPIPSVPIQPIPSMPSQPPPVPNHRPPFPFRFSQMPYFVPLPYDPISVSYGVPQDFNPYPWCRSVIGQSSHNKRGSSHSYQYHPYSALLYSTCYYPNHGYPNHGHGYPNHGYPNHGQGYPNYGYPNHGYGYPNHGMSFGNVMMNHGMGMVHSLFNNAIRTMDFGMPPF